MPGPGPPAMPVLGAPPLAGVGGGGAFIPDAPVFGGGVTLPGLPPMAAVGVCAGVPAVRAVDPAIGDAPLGLVTPGAPLTAALACASAPPTPVGPHAGGHALCT
jgi:hypothetical protein